MEISVIIPTLNRRDVLMRTLNTLFLQDFPRDQYQVIVVVDGSTDDTSDTLRRTQAPCRLQVIEQPTTTGIAAARNRGLHASTGELVLFLDDDISCSPGLLQAHVRAQAGGQPVLAIGAVFLSDDSPRTLASDCFEVEIGWFYVAHKRNPELQFPAHGWVFKNTSVRSDLVLRAGGFSSEFNWRGMQREDQDLGVRLGLPIRYVPEAIGYEFYTKTPSTLVREAEEFARADALLLRTHPELWPGSRAQELANEGKWKRLVHLGAAGMPWLVDPALKLLWTAGEHFRGIPLLRRVGLQALRSHRGLVWYRAFRQHYRQCGSPVASAITPGV